MTVMMLKKDTEAFRRFFRHVIHAVSCLKVLGDCYACRLPFDCWPVAAQPDLLLIDQALIADRGPKFLEIWNALPPAKIMLLETDDTPPLDAHRLVLGGIQGRLNVEEPREVCLQAIQTVFHGDYWFPRGLMSELLRSFVMQQAESAETQRAAKGDPDETAGQGLDPLTPREEEVFIYLKRGLSNKQIARSLQLSPETIKIYVKHVCQKLGLRNRYEAPLATSN